MIRHKETAYPGTHEALIDKELWDRVQKGLQDASARQRGTVPGAPAETATPLKGKIRDELGDLLTPTYCQRGPRRYHYYVSNRLISKGPDGSAWRLPSRAFEKAVTDAIVGHLADHSNRYAIFAKVDTLESRTGSEAIKCLVSRIEVEGICAAAPLIAEAQVATGEISIALDTRALIKATGIKDTDLDPDLLRFSRPLRCRRGGVEMKITAGDQALTPDPVLFNALRRAHAWSERLRAGASLTSLAASEGVSERYMGRIIHLAGLSPRLQEAIIRGTQPQEMSLKQLLKRHLPLDWTDQEARLRNRD